jgi:hypothetical protein
MRLRALVLARSVPRRTALHASHESLTVRVPRTLVVLAAAALRHALIARGLRELDPERARRAGAGDTVGPAVDDIGRTALGCAGVGDATIEIGRGRVVGARSTPRTLGARRFGKTCRDLRTATLLQAHAARAAGVEVRLAAAVAAATPASRAQKSPAAAAASGCAAGARAAVAGRTSAAQQPDPRHCEQGANSTCFHPGSPFCGHSFKSYAPRTPKVSHSCRALFDMLVETHWPPAAQTCWLEYSPRLSETSGPIPKLGANL